MDFSALDVNEMINMLDIAGDGNVELD